MYLFNFTQCIFQFNFKQFSWTWTHGLRFARQLLGTFKYKDFKSEINLTDFIITNTRNITWKNIACRIFLFTNNTISGRNFLKYRKCLEACLHNIRYLPGMIKSIISAIHSILDIYRERWLYRKPFEFEIGKIYHTSTKYSVR